MSSIFCCSSIKPFRPVRLDHEAKFGHFMRWTKSDPVAPTNGSSLVSQAQYAVQLVRQVNYGPQESIRYFIPVDNNSTFLEVTKDDLLSANYKKLNSFKNFRCEEHNKFFELNLYQENPTNAHHWRANLERPARDIDLALRKKELIPVLDREEEEPAASAPGLHRPSSDLGEEISPSEPRNPLIPGHQMSEVESHEKESLAQLVVDCSTKISTLKPILRFLLPGVGASLGSNSLMSLISLDWVNRELELGIDYEDRWNSEVTSQNISIFLNACIEFSGDESVSLTDIEDLVDYATFHIESLKDKQVIGRIRFENIVNWVLEHNPSVGWVSQNASKIRRILASGPSEELFESCRRRDEEMPQRRLHIKDTETIATWFTRESPIDDDSDNSGREHDYEPYSDNEAKDYAACDKECGYCGNCDY